MPRRSKGPRLYLRQGRIDNRTRRPLPAIWYIRDRETEISTGCGPDELHGPHGAESQLGAYVAAKWAPRIEAADPASAAKRRSDPDHVLIADVLALYTQERAPKLADPAKAAASIKTLLGWWGDKTVSDVKRSNCAAYVVWRCGQSWKSARSEKALARKVTDQAARRELEDLSAAIGYWDDEHHLSRRPKVSLPDKPSSPRDALTRNQAAALLWAAMGWRKKPDGTWKRIQKSSAANRAHLRRFILIGLYTGTRPGVIPKLLWHESATRAWVDLDAGVIYRRGRDEPDHPTKRRPMVKIPRRLAVHMRRWKKADEELMAARGKVEMPTTSAVLHHGARPIGGRIRTGYEGCVRDAGLPAEITPHWHRHTAATWLMQNGADIWEAAGYLGMTTKTLEDHYAHHRPDYQAGAVKAIGGRRSGA